MNIDLNTNMRQWSLVLNQFRLKGGKRVVEIGSVRSKKIEYVYGDGCSTIVWAQNVDEVYTVDINPDATALAKEVGEHYGNVHAINQDGIEFLNNFSKPIDLLYLDGWDIKDSSGNYLPEAAKKHLEAYHLAKKNLHDDSLVLIDDMFSDGKGKGEYVIPEMIGDGWHVLFSGYQILLGR